MANAKGKSGNHKARRWCKGKKQDGTPCQAYPLKGEDWCMLHHPERENLLLKRSIESREERAKKEKERKEYWENLDGNVEGTKDVKAMLLRAISEVHDGDLTTQQGSCISALSGHLIKTLEVSQLEERMRWLEERLREQQDKEQAKPHLNRHVG